MERFIPHTEANNQLNANLETIFLTSRLLADERQRRTREQLAAVYPASYFAPLNSLETYKTIRWAREIQAQPSYEPVSLPEIDLNEAQAKRRELNYWNRATHTWLLEVLEQPYLDMISRVRQRIEHEPETVGKWVDQVHAVEIPYAFAALPPHLFDHLPDTRPFLPRDNEGIAQLVSGFRIHHERLERAFYTERFGCHHPTLSSADEQMLGFARELQRLRHTDSHIFDSEEGQLSWKKYSETFRTLLSDIRSGSNMSPFSLYDSAVFIGYPNNRRFTEEGGLYAEADGRFSSFLLANIFSNSIYTSQIRAPIGHYGLRAAHDLLTGIYIVMQFIMDDLGLHSDARRLIKNIHIQNLLDQHILRSTDHRISSPMYSGVVQTGLEGTLSAGNIQSIIEADGLPGFENNLDAGIKAAEANKSHTRITASTPVGSLIPGVLEGPRFTNLLVGRDGQFRIRPEIVQALRRIEARRTLKQYDAWLAYYQGKTPKPPVRFGLRCPFKGPVVQEFAQTITIGRRACRPHLEARNYDL